MPTTSPSRLLALLIGAQLLCGCTQSCQKTSGPAAARDDLALAPKETDIVFMGNINRARGTAMWKKLLELRDRDELSKKQYQDFIKKCQFDPLTQLDSLFLALPQNAADNKEFALIARGTFTAANMVSCLRITAKEQGGKEVVEQDYNGHKLYSVPGQEGIFTVLGPKIVALAGKEWVKKVVDAADNKVPGQGARDHKELADLMKRTRTGEALWGAGLVPESVAQRLRAQPQLGTAATMKSVFGSIDFEKGTTLHLTLDLATPEDAAELSKKVTDQLQGARKERNVQLLGLTHYFDTIKVEAQKQAFSVQIDLNQQQVDDLSNRLSGLLKTFDLDKGPPSLP